MFVMEHNQTVEGSTRGRPSSRALPTPVCPAGEYPRGETPFAVVSRPKGAVARTYPGTDLLDVTCTECRGFAVRGRVAVSRVALAFDLHVERSEVPDGEIVPASVLLAPWPGDPALLSHLLRTKLATAGRRITAVCRRVVLAEEFAEATRCPVRNALAVVAVKERGNYPELKAGQVSFLDLSYLEGAIVAEGPAGAR